MALVSQPRAGTESRGGWTVMSGGARVFEDALEGRIRAAVDRVTEELVKTQQNITFWKPKKEKFQKNTRG